MSRVVAVVKMIAHAKDLRALPVICQRRVAGYPPERRLSNLVDSANRLYFGDNVNVLRERIADESVDLIYLDPPFNSNANYNVLFKAQTGQSSQAQAEAFRDTWEWGEPARDAYDDVMRANGDVALIVSGLRKSLGDSAMMAYLAMMAARFIELRRVLKPSGSLYLHCDPTASHYLKVIVDAAFGPTNYRNEISWRRQSAHNDAKQGHRRDKTAVHSEYVQNLAVRKNIPLKALDELVHPDACLASVFLGHCKRFDMGIELTPLSSPVGADLVFSDNLAALRSLGPAHVLRHQC
jgi:hypothetical protein